VRKNYPLKMGVVAAMLGSNVWAAVQPDWDTHVVADRLTDERSLVTTKTYQLSSYNVQAQLTCIPSKSLSYSFTLDSNSGVEFESNILGITSFRLRLDGGEIITGIAQQAKREQTSPVIAISSDNLVQDYHDAVRVVAGTRISNKNEEDWQYLVRKYSIPDDANWAIFMAAMARRVRIGLETTAGTAVVDFDQDSPGPASVLRLCGLNRQKFVQDVNDTESKTVQALRELAFIRQKREADEARDREDQQYNIDTWPVNSGVAQQSVCRVSIKTNQYVGGCNVMLTDERLDLYPITNGQPIPSVQLRLVDSEAFGIVNDPKSGTLRTGTLTREGACWTGGGFVICVE
jgi:hypothetical protein